jgi:hypothetical protein
MDPNNLLVCASKSSNPLLTADVQTEIGAMEAMVQRNLTTLQDLDAQLEGEDARNMADSDAMLIIARLGHMHLELSYVRPCR